MDSILFTDLSTYDVLLPAYYIILPISLLSGESASTASAANETHLVNRCSLRLPAEAECGFFVDFELERDFAMTLESWERINSGWSAISKLAGTICVFGNF